MYSPSVLHFSIKRIQSACVKKIAFDTAFMTVDVVIIREINNAWSATDEFPNRVLPHFKHMLAY
jgi:hypothetical protein